MLCDVEDDEWTPVLEPITNEQVRRLNELLAMPCAPEPDFVYFDEDD